MAETFYYAGVDMNRVLVVDELESDHWTLESVAELAACYPEFIYFKIDNVDPEFRVPVSGNIGSRWTISFDISADPLTQQLVLTCQECGAAVCAVEDGDTMRVLLNTALAHGC